MTVDALEQQQDALLRLAEREPDGPHAFPRIAATLRDLYVQIARAHLAGVPLPELRERLAPARAVHGRSPFVRRLQFPPRGHAGDFETCEEILAAAPRPPMGSLARAIEVVALSWPIVAQHRHVVAAHASELSRVADLARRTARPARVLVVGAGSAPEVRAALPALRDAPVQLVVNDRDPSALAFCRVALAELGERVSFRLGDATSPYLGLDQDGRFDLVLASGLLDHLGDLDAVLIMRQVATRWLAPAGQLVASHLAGPCPARALLESLTSWRPIERSERQVRALAACAGGGLTQKQLGLDATGLTWRLVAGRLAARPLEPPQLGMATTLPLGAVGR